MEASTEYQTPKERTGLPDKQAMVRAELFITQVHTALVLTSGSANKLCMDSDRKPEAETHF